MKIQNIIRSFWFLSLMIIAGVAVGIAKNHIMLTIAHNLSDVFMRLLKLVSLPIISFSLLSTLTSMGKWSDIKVLGKRVIHLTIFTTVLSAFTAWVLYLLIEPKALANTTSNNIVDMGQNSYFKIVLDIFPSNILQPFLEHNVMGVMFITLLLSFAVLQLPNEKREPLHNLFDGLFAAIMVMIRWITFFMPFAVWAFIVEFTLEVGKGLKINDLAAYLTIIIVANFIQAFISLPLMLRKNGIPPLMAFKAMLPALSLAFFSKSSVAAMPLAMECSHTCGVKHQVSKFSFPLCTSINMNACAAFILVTVLFVAENHGFTFTILDKLLWVGIATIAAIGNAGVPMGCFFLSCALLTAMGVPIIIMGIILPFYALLDMVESAINLWSDACVTLIVNKKTGN